MAYEIKIENFEGPLDLLLHLIRKHEMDIYDIPVAAITTQYLAYLEAMKTLNLDVAGEFLLMAATLVHIKSRMLLPQPEEETVDEEEEDPRAELVRRLLEYQKYKEAGGALDELPRLERDVFARPAPVVEESGEEEPEFEAVGLFELVEAFRRLLEEHPEEAYHEIAFESLSITERINDILSRLSGGGLAFAELFGDRPGRQEVVVNFLAMLELVKMRVVRFMQNTRFGAIWLYPAVAPTEVDTLQLDEETLGYA